MTTLTENAQRHIEHTMRELSGDDDFLPFMTVRDAKDEVAYVGLMMPGDDEHKQQIADMMTALCMVYRGVEVMFASVSWIVSAPSQEALDKMTMPPSANPDRAEVVFMLVVDLADTDGKCTMHSAPVIRENNMIGVGLWESNRADISGRFAESIVMGMRMGQALPPDMCEFLDEEIEADRIDQHVKRMAQLIGETRKEMWKE